MQRLRLTFTRDEQLGYISHLDITRLWERVFRRADLPLTYSQGFSPHPKISIAAPLSLGVTSEGELMDVEMDRRVATPFALKKLAPELPPGIEVRALEEVPLTWPSLQSSVRFAEYRVTLSLDESLPDLQGRIAGVMQAGTLPRERWRDKELRRYDLRPLIAGIWIHSFAPGQVVLGLRLQTDERATGRPDEVLSALGLAETPRAIHRTRLIVSMEGA